jgi:L,D-transpeptidase catalytic domain
VRRRAVVGALLLAAAAVVGLVKVVDQVGGKAAGSSHPADRWSTDAVEELPRPPRPAFTVSRPMLLDRGESRARFAPVVRTVEARALPRRDSAPVALLPHETEERTTNIVLVLGEARADRGTWVHVRLPVLPNDRTAWVPRSTLGGYEFVDTRLVVDLARFTATLLRDGRPVFRTVVGVGQTAWPTPKGAFYIRDRVTDFDDPFYGPIAFGTSARRLARGRLCRHPRNQSARADPRPHLSRLHPHAERGHRPPSAPDAGRDAADDQIARQLTAAREPSARR